jgi:hypothetical protein
VTASRRAREPLWRLDPGSWVQTGNVLRAVSAVHGARVLHVSGPHAHRQAPIDRNHASRHSSWSCIMPGATCTNVADPTASRSAMRRVESRRASGCEVVANGHVLRASRHLRSPSTVFAFLGPRVFDMFRHVASRRRHERVATDAWHAASTRRCGGTHGRRTGRVTVPFSCEGTAQRGAQARRHRRGRHDNDDHTERSRTSCWTSVDTQIQPLIDTANPAIN